MSLLLLFGSEAVDITVNADSALAIWTVPDPAAIDGGGLIVVADSAISTWTIPAPTITTDLIVVADSAISTWAVPDPAILQDIIVASPIPAIVLWRVPNVANIAGGAPGSGRGKGRKKLGSFRTFST